MIEARITGLNEVKELLGTAYKPALSAGLQGLALEIEDKIVPYGKSGIWNSPTNPTGRWYERGYGPRWWVAGEGVSAGYAGKSKGGQRREVLQAARRGRVEGRKTSEMLNRSWHVEKVGELRYKIFSHASYAPRLHAHGEQADWAKRRGWVTDREAIVYVIRSGKAQQIIIGAVMRRLR